MRRLFVLLFIISFNAQAKEFPGYIDSVDKVVDGKKQVIIKVECYNGNTADFYFDARDFYNNTDEIMKGLAEKIRAACQ